MGETKDAWKSVGRNLGILNAKKPDPKKEATNQRRREGALKARSQAVEQGDENWEDAETLPPDPQSLRRDSATPRSRISSPHKGKQHAKTAEEIASHSGSLRNSEKLSKASSKESKEADRKAKKAAGENSSSPKSKWWHSSRPKSGAVDNHIAESTDNPEEARTIETLGDVNKAQPPLPIPQLDPLQFAEDLRTRFKDLEQNVDPVDVHHATNTNKGINNSRVPEREISPSYKKEEVKPTASFQARDPDHGLARKPVMNSRMSAPSGVSDNSQFMQRKQDTNSSEHTSEDPLDSMIDEFMRDPGFTNTHSKESDQDSPDELETVGRAFFRLEREYPSIEFPQKFKKPFTISQVEIGLEALRKAYMIAAKDAFSADQALDIERTKHANLKTCYDDLDHAMQDTMKEATKLATDNTKIINRLEGSISVYEAQVGKFDERMQKLNLDHAQKIERIKQDHINQQKSSKIEADKLFLEMKKKLEANLFHEEQRHLDTKTQHQGSLELIKNDYARQANESSLQLGSEIRKLKQDLVEKDKEIARSLTNREYQHQQYVNHLKEEHKKIVLSKDNELSDNRSVHAGNMSTAAEIHRRELQAVNAKLDKAVIENKQSIQAIRTAQAKALEDAGERLRSEINSLKFQLQQFKDQKVQELQEKESKHEQDKRMIDQKYRQEIESLKAEVNRLVREQDRETQRLKEEHKADKAAHVRALLLTNEDLKEALVARDHFKVMSDSEVSRRYLDISIEIDELARIPWDTSKQRTWPFESYSFHTSENERRAKKEILGNTLWVVLYELIFCTPFRVLGTKGRLLEQQWVKKFSLGQKYPEILYPRPPTKESETWRYEEMMRCVKAKSQPESQSDYDIKEDYEATLDECAKHLVYELEAVTIITDREKQQIKELVKAMAELWLEVGQLRWRIFFSLSNSNTKPTRSRRDATNRDGNLNLVVKPELRRMGNAQWDRLDMEEVIVDCYGKFSTFHTG